MKKQFFLISLLIISVIIFFLPQRNTNGIIPNTDTHQKFNINDSCPPVNNTPFFTIVYGSALINDVSAPIGSLVKAFSPRGDLVGCFSVTSAGNYGLMYVYGEDNTVIPPIPGMRANEEVIFEVEGIAAVTVPVLLWTNDKDLHQVDLTSAGISADFSATPRSGTFPLSVQFSDNSSGSITSWLWNFGDGQTSTETNPLHVFNSPGFYSISLTVTKDMSSDVETKLNYIAVYTTVNANFSASPTSGVAPLSVTFTNLSSGDYSSSFWNFGDGSTSSETNPIHTFNNPGSFTVTLSVTGFGGEDSCQSSIEVSDPPNYIYIPVIFR